MSNNTVDVIVIDDVCRFAIHLSRYLGFDLGFGIGKIPWHSITNEQSEYMNTSWPFWDWEKLAGENYLTEDNLYAANKNISHSGDVQLWWVPAVNKIELPFKNHDNSMYIIEDVWKKCLNYIISKVDISNSIIIMDVRGRFERKNTISEPYSPQKALHHLFKNGKGYNSELLYIISSYYGGNTVQFDNSESLKFFKRIPIQAKSPETFRKIQQKVNQLIFSNNPLKQSIKQVKSIESGERLPKPQIYHILVTGAGFEFSNHNYLDIRGEAFGLPNTWNLLGKMGTPFSKKNDQSVKGIFEKENSVNLLLEDQNGFISIGEPHIFRRAGSNLDAWWDLALWHKVIKERIEYHLFHVNPTGGDEKKERITDQITAIEIEYRMRDAFRKTLLNYDWGHMRQSIIASLLNWDCWLTTNYTRFSDRAIQLVESLDQIWGKDAAVAFQQFGHSQHNFQLRNHLWRIIGTTNAADRMLSGHLHDEEHDRSVNRRYLFKLHGDIAQLHTMAIAGHDKEPYSPLSMIIDSMSHIYTAAQTYLTQKFTDHQHAQIVWHVVGHGLNDKLLTRLLSLQHKHKNVHYVVVSPIDLDSVCSKVAELNQSPAQIHRKQATAAAYLSELLKYGPLPTKTQDWQRFKSSLGFESDTSLSAGDGI